MHRVVEEVSACRGISRMGLLFTVCRFAQIRNRRVAFILHSLSEEGSMRMRLNEFLESGEAVGVVELSGQEAFTLAEAGFERQRHADRGHVAALADLMEHDEWHGSSMLLFCRQNGGIVLVDGQHRLRAYHEAIKRGASERVWVAQIVEGIAEDVYASLDALQKKRPNSVVGEALGFEGLAADVVRSCMGIANQSLAYRAEQPGFPVTELRTMPGLARTQHPQRHRRAYINSRYGAFRALSEVVDSKRKGDRAGTRTKNVLLTVRVGPIVVETLHREPDTALPFWSAAVSGTHPDGLIPEHAQQVRDIACLEVPRAAKKRSHYKAREIARQWNLHYKPGSSKRRTDVTKPYAVIGTDIAVQ